VGGEHEGPVSRLPSISRSLHGEWRDLRRNRRGQRQLYGIAIVRSGAKNKPDHAASIQSAVEAVSGVVVCRCGLVLWFRAERIH
jgi:hypothetical protein